MKKLKRIFVLLLIVILVSTTQGTHVIAEENVVQTASEGTETLSQLDEAEKEAEQEKAIQEVTQEQSEPKSAVSVEELKSESAGTTGAQEGGELESLQEQETEAATTSQADAYVLPEIGFVYAETMELDVPGTQNIALVLNEEVRIDSPKVRYRIGDSEKVYTIDLTKQVENVLLFTENYTTDSPTGVYRIIGFSYEVHGKYYEVGFETETTYSVGEEGVITENENLINIADAVSLAGIGKVGSLVEASIIELEDGLSASEISSALANAQAIAAEEGVTLKSTLNSRFRGAAASNLVVVLAPGHCATHNGGAVRGNLREESLVLAIAKYAKAELETYAGVTVYLSQTTESCTWGTNLSTCLSGHADYAAGVGANVLISLHINATETTTTTATGAEAIITIHSSYYSSMYNLSASILAQLAKVGLSTRRIYTDADDGDRGTYATGQLVDDFSVIRNSVLQGIPAFILEHAFINNLSDQALLSSAGGLQSIGIADATGIANYYGLTKKSAANELTDAQKEDIKTYVTRLYHNLLGRTPDAEGLNYWINVLIDKKATGAETAMYFLNSREMKNKSLTDTAYVNLLYTGFLGRTGESEGVAYWKKVLGEYGFSRTFVAVNFVHSPEFSALCTKYGITRGTVSVSENRDKNTTYTKFVARLYKKAFNRTYDVGGLNYWTGLLVNGTMTPETVAEKFFTYPEMIEKGYSNADYVNVLYRTFLDREPDPDGYNYHFNRLNSGVSRVTVMYGFSRSAEFKRLIGQ